MVFFEKYGSLVYQFDQFINPPNVIRNPCLHRRCDPQRLVNPAEVVVHEVEGDRRDVVLQLLAEGVGQAREPPHAHPHGEVLPLHVARGDVLGVRVAA